MEATQFDAAIEWYFAPQGSLYTTLFYKDLKNYLLRGTQAQNLFGQDWQVDSTVNGDKGTVKGFEIGYSQFYDELPGWLRGLGMQANFTYVDSEGGSPTAGPSGDAATVPPGLPLEGLSKKSYNVVGLYQRGPVEARVAYNWRERWLLTTHDGDGKGSVWNDDYGQLDASIFVRINDHLQVGLEGNNLTNSTQKLLVGPYRYTLAADGNTPAYNVGYTDWTPVPERVVHLRPAVRAHGARDVLMFIPRKLAGRRAGSPARAVMRWKNVWMRFAPAESSRIQPAWSPCRNLVPA